MKIRRSCLVIGLPVIVLASTFTWASRAQLPWAGYAWTPASAYTGPCDVVSCAGAWSVTHAMKASYSGNLFQLSNGSSTLNVGQTGAHAANLSGIPAFCANAFCVYSKIYDQVGSADLVPVTGTPGFSPSQCTTGNACAAPYIMDAGTGLPIVDTAFPSEYDVLDSAVNGGANPTSIFYYARNEQWPGEFGIGHSPVSSNINGTNFIAVAGATNVWTTAGGNYTKCATATTTCLNIDEETSVEPFDATNKPGAVGASYGSGANSDISVMVTWDGSSIVKGYVNSATALFTDSPPSSVQYDSSALVPGQHVKLGCGGDCTQSQAIWRDGLIANATLTSTDYTNLTGNESAFYTANATTPACTGIADLGYYMSTAASSTNWQTYKPPSIAFLSYGLAQLHSWYYGPIADLNNGSTTQTFTGAIAAGSTGCGLDPAAATFCSGGCTVVKLYQQAPFNLAFLGNQRGTLLDLSFAVGHRPTVVFAGLNGLPTMSFGGADYGCSGTGSGDWPAYFAISVVAERTGNTSAYASIFDSGTFGTLDELQIGFNNSTNSVFNYWYNALGTQAATDSHWHSIYTEDLAGTKNQYVDGSAGTPFSATSSQFDMAHSVCIGAKSDGSQPLTGNIAEIDLLSVQSFANSGGYVSLESAVFSALEARWGTLPN